MSTCCIVRGEGVESGEAAQRDLPTCCKCLYASVPSVCTPPLVGMHASRHRHDVILILWAGVALLSSSVLALGDGGGQSERYCYSRTRTYLVRLLLSFRLTAVPVCRLFVKMN